MSKTRRLQHEREFLRKLQNQFTSARKVESFEDATLFIVEFADGTEQDVTLHAEFRPSSVTSLHPYGAALVSTNSAVPSFVRE